MTPLSRTQHLVGTFVVDLAGDEATSRCYLHAQHVRAGVPGGEQYVIAGCYRDRFTRTADGWRIRERRLDRWRADMAAVAARPNTWCKLSGLVTEAPPEWRTEDLRPYVDHLLAALGPERLLWGSDWPHTQFESAVTYGATVAQLEAWLPDPQERGIVLGETPMSLFRF